ncbi:unnamed protein product [Prorocentrum cordatum]|uniref:Uncharacterized protein n=1 Tax=Prorocentrum cordatum TaxID=2364126 RepID=A0ABN9RTG2_9DINO|nr:unnamed protein product [Polarella glacialis]
MRNITIRAPPLLEQGTPLCVPRLSACSGPPSARKRSLHDWGSGVEEEEDEEEKAREEEEDEEDEEEEEEEEEHAEEEEEHGAQACCAEAPSACSPPPTSWKPRRRRQSTAAAAAATAPAESIAREPPRASLGAPTLLSASATTYRRPGFTETFLRSSGTHRMVDEAILHAV